ncbi:peptide ABC transporter substrate-binding protein [Streptomyces sp. NPDC047017]|uniref:peptide ABC transporter substrate-binding protein n=1 Tax=Streptomyces sp. NPDC047017 TaxID=3155024 RepID=UPI0033F4B441
MSPARIVPRRMALVAGTAVSVGALLAGCAGYRGSSSASTDSVNYALPANFTPNWILPVGTAGHLNTNNASIAATLWEPLVAYDGSTGAIGWNKAASVATAADFAADGRSVTITLGDRHWSDGTPVTSRDVEFWYNLVKANKAQWANYNPGRAPDNWTSLKAADDHHFTLTFDKAYNSQWMLGNELSLIIPLPQHAWDRTGASAAVSDADRTPAGAKRVWDFLNSAAGNISRYATDPLWKTIDGPYSVSSFTTSGHVRLTANPAYDGGEKPGIRTVNLLPFTTPAAEENALRAGQVDYGYLDVSDLGLKSSFSKQGYTVKPWSGWAITYMPYNFANPAMGAVFKQLYARQAIQTSIDQAALAKAIYNGTAVPGYGPVPQAQSSVFLSPAQRDNPYPYSTAKAGALLTGHGWTLRHNVMTCTDAGTGDHQCGAGVARGTEFRMRVLAQSGSTVTDNMLSALQSMLSDTGIGLSIKTAPVNSVLSQTPACTADQPICSWQLSYFGTAGSWYFPPFPTGDSLFQSKGGSNFGGYSNAADDALITTSTTSGSTQAVRDYSAALARNLPVIWLPEPDYQISVIRNGLGGFAQDSLANFHPAQWKWTGK